MVCITTEFGRTPKINGTGGRDHWPKVFSVVMAGGGIARGKVYGSSDATAAEPQDNPLTVEDFSMTLYHCLGIGSERKLMAPGNRPVSIVRDGQVIRGMLVEKIPAAGCCHWCLRSLQFSAAAARKPPRRSLPKSIRPV